MKPTVLLKGGAATLYNKRSQITILMPKHEKVKKAANKAYVKA